MNTIGSALFNRPKSDSRSTLISLSRSSETQGPQCSRNVCQTKVIVSDRRKQNYSSGKPISSTSVQQFKYSSRTKCLQYYAYGATRYDGYVWFQGLPPAPPNIHPWLPTSSSNTRVSVYAGITQRTEHQYPSCREHLQTFCSYLSKKTSKTIPRIGKLLISYTFQWLIQPISGLDTYQPIGLVDFKLFFGWF